jgi:hypothetical protein
MKKVFLIIFAALVCGGLAAKRAWFFGDSKHVITRDGLIYFLIGLVAATAVVFLGRRP